MSTEESECSTLKSKAGDVGPVLKLRDEKQKKGPQGGRTPFAAFPKPLITESLKNHQIF
ncbi:MAG TPA: hypothetical protein VGR55_11175 [Candidatus Acidoferrum sp.]|nr:hypothetical protein [Candidatus Acidoferrum sp.]